MIGMESVVVDQFNAFAVNAIGLERRPFPRRCCVISAAAW